eukprot:733860-Hanusia_phi.AAC.1
MKQGDKVRNEQGDGLNNEQGDRMFVSLFSMGDHDREAAIKSDCCPAVEFSCSTSWSTTIEEAF